jgi:hypothetical protein
MFIVLWVQVSKVSHDPRGHPSAPNIVLKYSGSSYDMETIVISWLYVRNL